MKKNILFFTALILVITCYSQKIEIISSKENQKITILFIDSLNNQKDELSINDFNPWNKLPYLIEEMDIKGNNKYVVSKAELKEIFNHEIKSKLFDTSHFELNTQYILESDAFISQKPNKHVVISYNLLAYIRHSDQPIFGKSHVFILDNKKNIVFENRDHTFINRSIVVSNNAEYLAYRTGIDCGGFDVLIPVGFEIFDVSKGTSVFYDQGIFNLVLFENELNLIRVFLTKSKTDCRIFLHTKKKVIYIYECDANIDKMLIDIKEEGLYYQNPLGKIELVTFESMPKIRLL